MGDIDRIVDDAAMASSSARPCSVCGARLSRYNRLGVCFRHPDPAKEQKRANRQKRIAELVQKKNNAVLFIVPSSPGTSLGTTSEGRPRATFEIATKAVCELFDVTEEELRQAGRKVHISKARQILMYVLYKDILRSYKKIGAYLGGRDHTTILHGVRTVGIGIKKDPQLQEVISRLRTKYGVLL